MISSNFCVCHVAKSRMAMPKALKQARTVKDHKLRLNTSHLLQKPPQFALLPHHTLLEIVAGHFSNHLDSKLDPSDEADKA